MPKYPEDLEQFYEQYEKLGVDEPRSVYEEFALIKFLEPFDNPMGIVLAAIFNVKNYIGVDLKEIFIKKFGKLPTLKRLGIRGEKLDTELLFIRENESWANLNCSIVLEMK